jgi:methylmalonyl-CoA mutase cobalamin-binding subunit
VAPLNELVGEGWTRGEVQIFEEHLYTETVQGLLRGAIGSMPRADQRPRVLLTTFPQEPHGLGILMAEATFALEGCHCLSLGVQTPLWDIALAAQAQRADIVALSFSASLNPNQVLDGLAELRGKLPARTGIWAGGRCAALQRRPPEGVLALRGLDEIAPALARWRQENLLSEPGH